ncbi:MAG: hypothetical protein JWQ16_1439 [Novosphingobium sp.]|nr:hypothetical protein [Novosphingobium sp.]
MKWTSILAIFTLFWVFSAFLVLPFGVRTHEEAGVDKVAGQADSAPANFSPKRIFIRATVVSIVAFGLYYANYVEGWLPAQSLDFFDAPPNADGSSPT